MNGSVVNVVCFEWSVMNGSVLNGNPLSHGKYHSNAHAFVYNLVSFEKVLLTSKTRGETTHSHHFSVAKLSTLLCQGLSLRNMLKHIITFFLRKKQNDTLVPQTRSGMSKKL